MEKRDPGLEIKALEEKRETLEQAVKIALNIEQLHKSLEATLLMGESSADIPEEALATFESLESSTQDMPLAKLKKNLASLEQAVKAKLAGILEIAEMSDDALLASDPIATHKLLNNFRKLAQTAVALRILLHTRGEATDATELHVPTEQIRAKLTVVTQKERAYRKVIKTEMVSMITETERLLTNPDISDSMRDFLTVSNADLQNNLDHLDSGKSITSMPVAVEMIEMSETEITTLDTSGAADTSSQKDETPSLQKQTVFAPMNTPQAPEPATKKAKKKGFFGRMWEWATTPDEVSWKKTRDSNKQNRRK